MLEEIRTELIQEDKQNRIHQKRINLLKWALLHLLLIAALIFAWWIVNV